MLEKISKIVSWVFVPLFMPMYALLILMYIPSREDYIFNDDSLYFLHPDFKVALLTIFFIFSILAPGLTLVILLKRGYISNIEIDDKRQRLVPLLITAFYCLVLYIFFMARSNVEFPKYIYALPLSGFITISLFAWINFYTKISLHACGTGILAGLIYSYCAQSIYFHFSLLLIAVFVAGLVMAARVYLNKHTLPQVIYGFSGSAIIVYLITYYYPTGY